MIFSVHRVLLRWVFRIRHSFRRLAMPQLLVALLLIGTSILTLSSDIAPSPALAAPHASQSTAATTGSASTVSVVQGGASSTSSTSNVPIISTGQPLVSITPSPGITPLIPPPTGTVQTTSSQSTAPGATPTSSASTPLATTGTISPLIFGTNLGLFDAHDQVLTSAATRTLLTQMRMPIIRMPLRATLSDAIEVQAAQAIKQIGATPLVILRGAVNSSVLADDTRAINYLSGVFGNSTIYYEYGNEEDLAGIKVNQYVASWNSVVPQLQRLAPNARFIGPVNYQYDANYLRTFLQQANPRPAAVSWHEYTCDVSWTQDVCIAHIDNWTKHVSDARAAMTATLGTTLPIMITEWNYAPNATANDGKNNDRAFMTTWTAKALQTLATNNIYAAMQYSATNTVIPLIDSSGAMTTQGAVFQTLYQQLLSQGRMTTPTPLPTTTATPTTAPTPTPLVTPTPASVPSPTPTSAPSPTPTPGVTPTPTPIITPTPTPGVTPTATPTPKPTATPSPTATPTAKPSPTVTPTATPADDVTPTATASPGATPSLTVTPTSTVSPTTTPTVTPTSTTSSTTLDSSSTATPVGTVTPTATKTSETAGTPTVTPLPETPTPSTSQVLNVL